MHQTWGKLLFLHWSYSPEQIRPLVPPRLELDTFQDRAWVGVTPFTMWDVRPHGLPAVPIASKSHELNVRTYVHYDGVPGVWFFSLDASNPLAVLGARATYSLPYYQAAMRLEERDGTVYFSSRRTHPGAPEARFEARWRGGEHLGEARAESREFFLVERYCLYARRGDTLLRARIHHRPWPLRQATLLACTSTMLQAKGLPESSDPPLLHMQADALRVEVWPLKAV